MCGITGFSGSLDWNTLIKMNRLISHRGLDDSGEWISNDGQVGLAHKRLSIIDTSSAGKQPMVDSNDKAIIVYNGEIYNFKELKKDLLNSGFSFKNNTDTEVILNLFLKYGENFLEKLNGIFTLAIYRYDNESLIVARDGMGVKPLYYTEKEGLFAFSSELKSLLCIKNINRDLDPLAIASYLTYLWAPNELTPLKSIRKFPPGCAMRISNGILEKKWRFYQIPVNKEIDKSLTAELATKKLDEALSLAVERQMMSDVPLGAFLSGGLDSSAIVHYARQFSSHKFETFTIGQNHKSNELIDDLPYANKVAKHLDVKLNTIWVGPEIVDSLEEMIFHLDEPQADPAALNAMFICKLARDNGIKVLLSGAGGDDLFTGYRRHYAIYHDQKISKLPLNLRKALSWSSSLMPQNLTFSRRVSKVLKSALLNEKDRLGSYFYWLDPSRSIDLLHSEFRQSVSSELVKNSLIAPLDELNENIPLINKMLFLECKNFLCDHNLNYTDKVSMAKGIEVRVPFLDKELVDFAFSLPPEFKQRGQHGKWILKKAMEPYLPKDVIYRPKTGFGVPLRDWLKGPLREGVLDLLSRQRVEKRGIFDYKAVESLIKMNDSGTIDATYSIFSIYCIEKWCQLFLDRDLG